MNQEAKGNPIEPLTILYPATPHILYPATPQVIEVPRARFVWCSEWCEQNRLNPYINENWLTAIKAYALYATTLHTKHEQVKVALHSQRDTEEGFEELCDAIRLIDPSAAHSLEAYKTCHPDTTAYSSALDAVMPWEDTEEGADYWIAIFKRLHYIHNNSKESNENAESN